MLILNFVPFSLPSRALKLLILFCKFINKLSSRPQHALTCLGSIQNCENTSWRNSIEQTNPLRNIFGQFWPCTPNITFGFCTCDSELGPLSDACTQVLLFAQQVSHQGLHLGLLNVLNLRACVLSNWLQLICLGFLKFLIHAEINCSENTSSLYFLFYLFIYNSKILQDTIQALVLKPLRSFYLASTIEQS